VSGIQVLMNDPSAMNFSKGEREREPKGERALRRTVAAGGRSEGLPTHVLEHQPGPTVDYVVRERVHDRRPDK